MNTVRVPPGEVADVDTDCITIERRGDGRFELTGSVLSGDDSVAFAIVVYDSFDEALAAGTAWAAGHGVRTLHVTTTAYEPEGGEPIAKDAPVTGG